MHWSFQKVFCFNACSMESHLLLIFNLFLVNIANKFQDSKEKNPTRKDKMSTLGNQYFKLKMFRYKGVFCFNFKIIKNPSALKWKWSPSRGCHSSHLNKNIASLEKEVAYCKVPKVGTNSWGSFFARSGKKSTS